jgi:hypothetical protein
MSLPERHPIGERALNPPCGSKSMETFHERRTVMLNLPLIDAMYHGAIFIFMIIAVMGIMIAVIGISMKILLRR